MLLAPFLATIATSKTHSGTQGFWNFTMMVHPVKRYFLRSNRPGVPGVKVEQNKETLPSDFVFGPSQCRCRLGDMLEPILSRQNHVTSLETIAYRLYYSSTNLTRIAKQSTWHKIVHVCDDTGEQLARSLECVSTACQTASAHWHLLMWTRPNDTRHQAENCMGHGWGATYTVTTIVQNSSSLLLEVPRIRYKWMPSDTRQESDCKWHGWAARLIGFRNNSYAKQLQLFCWKYHASATILKVNSFRQGMIRDMSQACRRHGWAALLLGFRKKTV